MITSKFIGNTSLPSLPLVYRLAQLIKVDQKQQQNITSIGVASAVAL
jgi:hypothetical protein